VITFRVAFAPQIKPILGGENDEGGMRDTMVTVRKLSSDHFAMKTIATERIIVATSGNSGQRNLLIAFFHFIKNKISCGKNGNDKIAANYIMIPWPVL